MSPSFTRVYALAGVTPDKTVVTYCQGGYRAAHTYLALRILGIPHVRNYTGSWKEWGDRDDLPIEYPAAARCRLRRPLPRRRRRSISVWSGNTSANIG